MNKVLKKYSNMPVQLKASVWFLACSLLQRGISVITTPIFTRLLSTSEFGKYSTFNSWWSIINVFVSLHLFSGVYTQGLVKFDEQKERYSSALQGLTVCLVAGWTVVYLIFHEWLNKVFSLTTIQMLALFSMIWTSAVFNFWAAEQRVGYKYKRLIAVTLVASLAKPTVGIILVLNCTDKVTARILGLAAVELVCYVGLFCSQMVRGKVFFSKRIWSYGLKLSIPLIPHYLSQTVLNNSDRIMIEKMVDSSSAGIYSLAYSLSMLMTLLNSALIQTIEPWMFRKIKDREIKDIGRISYVALGVVAVLNLLLIFFAPEIVAIFAPASYYEAIWVIPPVAMSVYFIFAYSLFADFEFYFEKTKLISLATGVGAALNIILNFIFIRQFGYIAAGYTTLICYAVYAVMHYIFMTKICNEYLDREQPYDMKKIAGITVLFVISGFLILLTYSNTLIRYILAFCVIVVLIALRKKIIAIVRELKKDN
jgi:O-antigen/teichoic acid export membrane protein